MSLWSRDHDTSPMTNRRLRTRRVYPNQTLRSFLAELDAPAPPPHRRGESSSTDGDGPRGQRESLHPRSEPEPEPAALAAEVDELAEDLAATTTFDPTWDCGALANAVCDVLVSQGKIKEKPAFIRTDRQAKITEVT